jgi:peptidoglycan/LPS O-acetylase OafA/YrhL
LVHTTGRENNFDAMRYVLAASVLFSHSWPVTRGTQLEPLAILMHRSITFGDIAVDAFFIISGYLIAASWERSRGFFAFLSKRIRRIYPAFLVLSLVTAFVVAPLFADGPIHWYTRRQLGTIGFDALDLVAYGYPYGNLYYVFAHNPSNGINSSLWTIRYEFVCYVLLGLAGTLGFLRTRRVLLYVAIAAAILYASGATLPSGHLWTAVVGYLPVWPRFLATFTLGAVWYRYRDVLRPSPTVGGLAALVLLLAMPFESLSRAVEPIALATVVFSIAFIPGRLNRFGKHGDFSYGLYIYGYTIQQVIFTTLGPMQPWTLFAMALPAATLAGACSWHGVERWALGDRNRRPNDGSRFSNEFTQHVGQPEVRALDASDPAG